jgi:hypothetical protein
MRGFVYWMVRKTFLLFVRRSEPVAGIGTADQRRRTGMRRRCLTMDSILVPDGMIQGVTSYHVPRHCGER